MEVVVSAVAEEVVSVEEVGCAPMLPPTIDLMLIACYDILGRGGFQSSYGPPDTVHGELVDAINQLW